MTHHHLLVVDDDDRIRALLKDFLEQNNFRVTTASSAKEARGHLQDFVFDVVVLDIMMPEEDGLSLTRSIKAVSHLPIILLTAKGDIEDRIEGLKEGADDYLAKPFDPRELLLRLNNIVKRSAIPTQKVADEICFGPYRYHLSQESLYCDNDAVSLTTAENRLLKIFLTHPNRVIAREDLVSQSDFTNVEERSIDVQVARLRRKLVMDEPHCLQTIRGKGYIFRIAN